MALEVAVGLYSWITGELAMPPWLGAGLAVVLGIALAGVASLLLGWRILYARDASENPP